MHSYPINIIILYRPNVLQWLPVDRAEDNLQDGGGRIKVEHTAYLSRHLQIGHRVRNLRSLPVNPLLFQSFSRIDFAKRGFLHSTPAVWNSLLWTVLESASLTLFAF